MNYWERAALLREIAIQEGAGYTAAQMLRLYDEALEDIETEIKKIQTNFQRRYGIDNKTASYFLTAAQEEENLKTLVKLLDEAPNAKAREGILEYIHRDGLSVRAYAARTERYKALEKAIYTRIKKLVIPSVSLLSERLQRTYKESYYGALDDTAKGLNIGINFAMINDRAVKEATEAKWHGSRFSERIWKNTDRLAERAQDLVVKSIISGESWTKTTAKLAAEFEVEKFNAATLVHTEAAHIHAQADLKAYADLNVEEYKYLATLDDRTCERCQALDGMVFKVSDARAGENFPTLHPRCRCTTTMNMEYKSRRARNPLTGKSELINGNMTYAEWKESLSPEQKAALELSQKKNSRKTADKLQHKQYMDVLGTKNVPRAFDKFQDLKYNDREKWQEIKSLYKGINDGTVIQNAGGQYVKIVSHTTLTYKPNAITQRENGKGGIDRNYYDENGLQYKQISNNGHGHKKEEVFGEHGEHVHDYIYNADGSLNSRQARELKDSERKENGDIL